MANTKETVEKTVIEVVEDLVQDWGLDIGDNIGGQALLVDDLDFSSVDIIQLCVALEQHYGRKLGFQDLLMKDGSYVADLSLSQVSKFILDRLNGG